MIQISIAIKNDRLHTGILGTFGNGITNFRRKFLFRGFISQRQRRSCS